MTETVPMPEMAASSVAPTLGLAPAPAPAPAPGPSLEPLPGPSHTDAPEVQLDSDVLDILGEDPTAPKVLSKEILPALAVRLEHIATSGLASELRKELQSKYVVPSNCPLIGAPSLNPEVKAAITDSVLKRDQSIEGKQKQLAVAISCVTEAITSIDVAAPEFKLEGSSPGSQANGDPEDDGACCQEESAHQTIAEVIAAGPSSELALEEVKYAGRLSSFYTQWQILTDDTQVLSWIQGYEIVFSEPVVQSSVPNNMVLSDNENIKMSEAINKLISIGAVSKCSACEESRRVHPDIEWELADYAFQDIVTKFGYPEIDLFASRINNKCKRYVSWHIDPDAYAINAFTIPWSGYFFYAFPPFSMILNLSIYDIYLYGKLYRKKHQQSDGSSTDYPSCRIIIRTALLKRSIPPSSLNIMMASLSENSIRQYDSCLKKWFHYCKSNNLDMYETSVPNLILFLTELFNNGAQFGTLNSCRSALSLISGKQIGDDDRVKRFFRGVFRLRPSLPKYSITWDTSIVLNFLSNWYPNFEINFENLTKN
ncbi:hypothetical protein ACJJTC_018224 [Scirpophaga incertulas]